MRIGKKSFITVVMLVFLLVVILSPFFFKKDKRVSRKELKTYMKEYVSEYVLLAEENFDLLRTTAQGDLSKFKYPLEGRGVISRTHGVAVFFNYQEALFGEVTVKGYELEGNASEYYVWHGMGDLPLVVEIKVISERIEYYIWPEMVKDTPDLPVLRVMRASGPITLTNPVNFSDGLIYVDPGASLRYTGEGNVYNFSGNGSIIIFGSLIYARAQGRMILKGTNNEEDWSKMQARFDALSEFIWDCEGILNASTIENIVAKYRLPLLLDRINSRMESGSYRDNPSLFTEDYEELKKVGVPDETLSKILNDYTNMLENPPREWYESLWAICSENMVKIIIGVTTTIIAAVIVKKYVEPKMKKRRKHRK